MCGFDKNIKLIFHFKRQWHIKIYYPMNQGIHCQKQCAISGEFFIDDVHHYRNERNDLRLIVWFRDR